MGDWADLPLDLVSKITDRLTLFRDLIVFSAVCKPWQSATYALKGKSTIFPKSPWLVLAEMGEKLVDSDQDASSSNDDAKLIRRFFNLSNSKIYEFELPEASGRNCTGANYGSIFTLGTDLQINLLQPLSRKQIPLPPMLAFSNQYDYNERWKPEDFFDMFVEKVALSSNPWKESSNYDSCIVAAIYGELPILAFSRPGNGVWTNIETPSRCYDDIIYSKSKGKFYAVDCHGVAFVCDINDEDGGQGRATVIAAAPSGTKDWDKKYLVEEPSTGDLLLVFRFRGGLLFEADDRESLRYYTKGFTVLKLEEEKSCNVINDTAESGEEEEGTLTLQYPFKWTEVQSLGDENALFLGKNTSVCLSASEFKGFLKANCIYFTDDDRELFRKEPGGGGRDMGIFSLEHGTIHPFFETESRHHFFPPFWCI